LDAASCELVRSTEIPDDGRSIRWSHDSRFIAIGANEFPILWNPIADQYLQGTPASERILDLAWSSDDRLIALGLRNGQIEICRTDTLEVVTRLKGHRGEAASVDWADHGRIASAGGDWMVRIWDAATGHELLALPHRGKSPFSSVRWSPDGRRLAAGDRDGRVLIWGSTELELLNRPESLGSGVIAETGLSVQRPLESMHADPPSPSEAIAGLRSEIAQQEAALAVLRREPESLELGLALVALAKLRWLETGEGWKSPLSEADQVFERLLEQNPDNADLAYAICGSLLSPWALTPERLRRAERRLFPEGLEKFIPRRQECPPPGIWPLLHAAYGRPEYQTHLDDMLQVWAELAKEDVSYATDELIGAHTRMFLKANKQGDHETAVELGETGLEVRRNADGDEHPGTMQAMRNLAVCYQNAHRHDEACEMGEEVLALRRKVLGSEHPDTLDALVVLAWALEGAGRFDDALEARLEVLEVSRELYGEEHVQALNAKLSLANAYEKVGRLDKAAELRGPGHELVEPDSPRATTILVPPTSVWRWLHPMDGVDPAEVDSDFHRSFFRADYDDASWQTGKDSQARIGLLGAQLTTEAEGVVVKALTPESPGGQDGLLAGDLIRTLDGEPFEEHPALVARLAATKPGERVVISVLRDDDVKELTVTLGSGPECGGFGYGDEWFTGVDIGTPAEKGLSKAAYFRHRFTTDKPFSNLELRCQRDDGIVVYLDGQEVGRANMNEGEESFLLAAESTVGDAAETTTFRLPLEGVTLQPGEHVLAISLHNTEAPSSDLRIGGITLVEVEEESE
jgi:tetratricopeptide (TPR) repeat protein